MIAEETLRDAIIFINENETKLIGLHTSSLKAGLNEEITRSYYDILVNFLEVRKHIYQLHNGITETSSFLEGLTGTELVQHFAEWDGR